MGLYGDRINPEQTRFQFDKVYTSRYEMDEEVAKGIDQVFQGRFVLVKYDQDFSSVPMYDIVEGYMDNLGDIYANSAKVPFVYTEFTQVLFNDIDNWSTYYYHYMIENKHFYFKLSHQSEYDQNNIYYIPTVEDETNLIYLYQFIRIGDDFYQCTGVSNNKPQFTKVEISNNQLKYLSNYQLDKNHYTNFDSQGYDGTVWQKVYTEGYGRFVIVAYLDSQNPEFQLWSAPPTTSPGEIYVDKVNSTDRVYRVKVPARWGFRTKKLTSTDMYNNQYKSDQTESNVPLDIYYNFGSLDNTQQKVFSHVEKHNKDTVTKNEIIIAPTGKDPSTIYYDTQGNPISNAKDIMELSVHLPLIGNMVADGYDLIYGYNQSTNVRPRDTQWYNADNPYNISGNPAIGGKSQDLNTLAGVVNSFQNRLGQMIQVHDHYPTDTELLDYNKSYIHQIKNTASNISDQERAKNGYYYRDTGYIYNTTNITARYYACDPPLKEYEYKRNRYYILNNGVYSIANGAFDENETYYMKNVESTLYNEIELAIYSPNTYFYQNGFNYVLDNAVEPTNIKYQYYMVTPSAPKHFNYRYGDIFYTDDPDVQDSFIAIPNTNLGQEPDFSMPYYRLPAGRGSNYVMQWQTSGYIYQSGKFCYYDENNKVQIDIGDTPDVRYNHFTYTIDYSQLRIIVDDEGNVLVGYEIIPGNEVQFANLTAGEDYYIRTTKNGLDYFQKLSTLQVIDQSYEYYKFNSNLFEGDIRDKIFVGNKYYIYNDNTTTYELQTTFLNNPNTNYYELTVTPIDKPFYEKGKYYFKEGNEYELITEYSSADIAGMPDLINLKFYKPIELYVMEDTSTENPYLPGYAWDSSTPYVPASVSLGVREEKDSLIPLQGIDNGESSLHGILLNLNRLYGKNNEQSRELTTFVGCINTFNDLLAGIKDMSNNKLLYVNRFGQIETTNYTYGDFINLMQKVDALGEVSDT